MLIMQISTLLKRLVVDYLKKQPGVAYAVDMEKIQDAPIPEPIKTMIINGYNYKRSGQVQVVFQPGWLESYARTGTTHGTWNPYDTHIPLIFMGWDIHPGASAARVNMTDIAPTLARSYIFRRQMVISERPYWICWSGND